MTQNCLVLPARGHSWGAPAGEQAPAVLQPAPCAVGSVQLPAGRRRPERSMEAKAREQDKVRLPAWQGQLGAALVRAPRGHKRWRDGLRNTVLQRGSPRRASQTSSPSPFLLVRDSPCSHSTWLSCSCPRPGERKLSTDAKGQGVRCALWGALMGLPACCTQSWPALLTMELDLGPSNLSPIDGRALLVKATLLALICLCFPCRKSSGLQVPRANLGPETSLRFPPVRNTGQERAQAETGGEKRRWMRRRLLATVLEQRRSGHFFLHWRLQSPRKCAAPLRKAWQRRAVETDYLWGWGSRRFLL